MRWTVEFRAVRVTRAVRGVAVVAAQRRRVWSVSGGERRLAGRALRVDRMDGRVGAGIGR